MYHQLVRGTTWNLAGYLYLIIASLVSTPLLIHALGLTQFAQYGLIIATLALTSSFDLGLPQAVVRALAREQKSYLERQSIWATSSVLFLTAGLLSAILATFIVSRFNHLPLIWLMTFVLALMTSLTSHYSTLPQAQGHFGYFHVKTFVVGTGNTLLAAHLASRGYDISLILAGQVGCYLLSLFILAYFSLKFFPHPREGRPSLVLAKSLLNFGIKNQLGKVVGQVQAQYAKYLLSSVSPLSLSAYLISAGLVQKLSGGISQLGSALYPASARSSGLSLRPLYYRLQFGLFLTALLGILVFRVWGLGFLEWWLHAPDLSSKVYSVMQVLIWYFSILVLTPLASVILDSRGRPEITSFFAFITTTLEIVMALLLFGRYGLFAPVYASLIAVALTTPFLLYATEKVLTIGLPRAKQSNISRSGVKSRV